MKNVFCFLTILIFAWMFASCGGKKSGDNTEESSESDSSWTDLAEQLRRDSTIYGVCADGTSMHTLEMISDNGDTLTLSLIEAQEANKVFGSMEIGDRLALLADAKRSRATWVVNLNELMGDWVMPNPLDGSSVMGVGIRDGGIAEGINQGVVVYKTWRLVNGMLELNSIREGGGDFEENELFTILYLSADSLAYRNSEEVFEYNRPGKVADYENLDDVKINFEDSPEDEVIM